MNPSDPFRAACAVILAGGAGTRIRHLLPDLPKPLAPVGGRPCLEWVIGHLARQGIGRFAVSLGHLAAAAEAYFSARPDDGLQIRTVCEPTPLGTGGGFLLAERAFPDADPLVVVNGDSLVPAEFDRLGRLLADPAVDGALLGVEVDDAARYGRIDVDAGGRLVGFCEKQPGRGLINAGVYVFRRRLLARFPAVRPLSMELDVFPALLAAGANLRVATTRAPFLDIGTPESFAAAEAFVTRCCAAPAAA